MFYKRQRKIIVLLICVISSAFLCVYQTSEIDQRYDLSQEYQKQVYQTSEIDQRYDLSQEYQKQVYQTSEIDQRYDLSQEYQKQDQQCDHIAVIGAGIGGSYVAWKLREQNLSVTVYEYSDRIGGRFHTVRFRGIPDINIELGAMRFIPELHPLINKTVHALGLTLADFKSGKETLMYLRGKHFRPRAAISHGAYNLKSSEMVKDVFHLRWSAFLNGTNYKTSDEGSNKTKILFIKTKDGRYLYKQSTEMAYNTIGLSAEAYKLLRDTGGFHSFYDDTSSSLIIPAKKPEMLAFKTVKEGMDQIPQKLILEFLNSSTGHNLKKNHRLMKIIRGTDGRFQLGFQKNVALDDTTADSDVDKLTMACANKVVLALPKVALQHLEWDGLKHTENRDILDNALKDAPAVKIFLAYENPWWRNSDLQIDNSLSDLPNRHTIDFGTSLHSYRSVLLAVYTDMEDVKFWRQAQLLGKPHQNCSVTDSICISEKVVDYAHTFLGEIYNISKDDIPNPIDGAILLWDNYPYGAAWHLWKPGYLWNTVQDRMIQPVAKEDVFISSGLFTFGEGDSWSESALSSAEEVLQRI